MTTYLYRVVLLLALALLAGCGGTEKSGRRARSPSAAEPSLPEGPGTKRALVLVDDDAPPSKKHAAEDDALSTPRIVKKVMGGDSR